MKIEASRCLIAVAVALAPTVASAPHEAHQAVPQATAQGADSAQLAACIEAQRQTSALLEAANARLETARQANQPAAMRSTIEDLQTVLSTVRTQLATCTQLQAANATPVSHDMANMPGMAKPGAPPSASATPAESAVDPHAGHTMPASPAGAGPRGAGPAPAHSHAGDGVPGPRAAPRGSAPPSADSHADHVAAGALQPTAPGRAPSAARAEPSHGTTGTASGDAHADHVEATLPTPATSFEELKCTSTVDAKTAPRMLYGGRMYYFCSAQDRAAFAKEPSKYAKATGTTTAPAHAH